MRKQKNGIVPQRPDQSGNDSGCRKAVPLRKFRHEKSSPANLFSKHRSAVLYYSDRCGEKEIKSNAHPRAHRAKSKVLGKTFDKLPVIKNTYSSEPYEGIRR